MTKCSRCNKNIGLLSRKISTDRGYFVCQNCYETLEKERRRKLREHKKIHEQGKKTKIDDDKKYMYDFIKKYIDNNKIFERDMHYQIIAFYQNHSLVSMLDKGSIEQLKNSIQSHLKDINISVRSGLSSQDIDEIIRKKKVNENLCSFIEDLEKIYRIFRKDDINLNYKGILSIFNETIINKINERANYNLDKLYESMKKKLGKKADKESVVRFVIEHASEGSRMNFEKPPTNIITGLFDRFNFDYTEEEVKKLIESIVEDEELKDFKKRIDFPQNSKIKIGDFTRLNGYEFEEYLKKLFTHIGYTVIKTPLSRDQGADLIISKDGKKTVVQAKKYEGLVSNKAVQEIVAAKNHYKAASAIVVTNSSFTKSAVELALSNNVELWDGMKLLDMIKLAEKSH
ncbi:MAG: restriction endonuclease [Pseudomonadota bacterium]